MHIHTNKYTTHGVMAHSPHGTYSAEASTLAGGKVPLLFGPICDDTSHTGIILVSPDTQHEQPFSLIHTEVRDMDVQYWQFRALPGGPLADDAVLTVYND